MYRLDQREIEKSRFATAWLREMARDHEIVISTQAMVRLHAVLTRKFNPVWPASDAIVRILGQRK